MIDFGDIEDLIILGYQTLSFPDSDADPEGWEKWSIYDDYDFLQFTGLYDKNNKEIYRGDIVKGQLDIENDNYDFIGPIEFSYGKFSSDNADFYLHMYELTVLDNIYENPELLK